MVETRFKKHSLEYAPTTSGVRSWRRVCAKACSVCRTGSSDSRSTTSMMHMIAEARRRYWRLGVVPAATSMNVTGTFLPACERSKACVERR